MSQLPFTIDFETEAIGDYPVYPPKPVGVSIWYPDAEEPIYLAWGHPSENNCTRDEARAKLASVWGHETLFHNGRFDTEVARVHLGLNPNKEPLKVHDTLFLNFLYDAHADTLSLKPSAERILGMPPDEQTRLREYLAGLGHAGKDWGAYISKAPGGIVGEYAKGDVLRTRKLYEVLIDHVNKAGMLAAYRREQKLASILNENEADGVRIDYARLEQDLAQAELAQAEATKRLLDIVGSCNPDSSSELAKALLKSGMAQEADFLRTPTGKLSTAKASMDRAVTDPTLRNLLQYRGHLKTLLTTFMRPWLEIASNNNGRMHPQFNQVRGDVYGTRTGRLSSSKPNLQNVPTELKGDAPAGLPPLPFMRQYILPDEGDELVSADFNGQEMRIAAHFAEGRAAEIYRNDPRADFHAAVAQIIKEDAGLDIDRKLVKITGFSLIYGSGINSLSELLGVDRATASNIRKHYFQALPGFKQLMDDVSDRGRAGGYVTTWGGRTIYAEKPKIVKGQQWTFEYKLLNHLIQGSAADQTKEAINDMGYSSPAFRFLATVHDENVYSVRPEAKAEVIAQIKDSMENQTGWDVPFKTEVEYGPNWWDLTKWS